jgi:hypothetical protein
MQAEAVSLASTCDCKISGRRLAAPKRASSYAKQALESKFVGRLSTPMEALKNFGSGVTFGRSRIFP